MGAPSQWPCSPPSRNRPRGSRAVWEKEQDAALGTGEQMLGADSVGEEFWCSGASLAPSSCRLALRTPDSASLEVSGSDFAELSEHPRGKGSD